MNKGPSADKLLIINFSFLTPSEHLTLDRDKQAYLWTYLIGVFIQNL